MCEYGTSGWVAILLVSFLVILWLLGGVKFNLGLDNYIGGGPSYRNWTSGASQRYATEFSGTNQGYPGNIATNVHQPYNS